MRKRLFAMLVCLIVFAGIVVLCFFFGNIKGNIEVPVGKYYLEKMIEKVDEKDDVETLYTAGDLYLEVLDKSKIKSFSAQMGMIQSEDVYTFSISGTNLSIKLNGQEKYTGVFAEKLIIIEIKETITENDKELEKLTEYYYYLQE